MEIDMKNLGLIVLGVWLIASGLIALIDLNFRGMQTIMAVLALVAGILIVIRR